MMAYFSIYIGTSSTMHTLSATFSVARICLVSHWRWPEQHGGAPIWEVAMEAMLIPTIPYPETTVRPRPSPHTDMNQPKNFATVVGRPPRGTWLHLRSCVTATHRRIAARGNLRPRDSGSKILLWAHDAVVLL